MVQGSPRDRSGLSTNPQAVRARLRTKGNKIHKNAAAIEEEMLLLPNYKPLSEWDLEELARGKPRRKDGTFAQTPKWLVGTISDIEIKKRLKEKAFEAISMHVGTAVEVIGRLLMNDDVDYETGKPIVDARTRLDAAKFIVEHVVGKAKVRIDEDTTSALGSILATVIVGPDGSDEVSGGMVIDGEWVENDDEPTRLPAVRGARRGAPRADA